MEVSGTASEGQGVLNKLLWQRLAQPLGSFIASTSRRCHGSLVLHADSIRVAQTTPLRPLNVTDGFEVFGSLCGGFSGVIRGTLVALTQFHDFSRLSRYLRWLALILGEPFLTTRDAQFSGAG